MLIKDMFRKKIDREIQGLLSSDRARIPMSHRN